MKILCSLILKIFLKKIFILPLPSRRLWRRLRRNAPGNHRLPSPSRGPIPSWWCDDRCQSRSPPRKVKCCQWARFVISVHSNFMHNFLTNVPSSRVEHESGTTRDETPSDRWWHPSRRTSRQQPLTISCSIQFQHVTISRRAPDSIRHVRQAPSWLGRAIHAYDVGNQPFLLRCMTRRVVRQNFKYSNITQLKRTQFGLFLS